MPTSIRLDDETEARLTALATKTGRTKAYYLREIITSGLDDAEAYYLAAETARRVREGKEPVHSSADVRRALGLEN